MRARSSSDEGAVERGQGAALTADIDRGGPVTAHLVGTAVWFFTTYGGTEGGGPDYCFECSAQADLARDLVLAGRTGRLESEAPERLGGGGIVSLSVLVDVSEPEAAVDLWTEAIEDLDGWTVRRHPGVPTGATYQREHQSVLTVVWYEGTSQIHARFLLPEDPAELEIFRQNLAQIAPLLALVPEPSPAPTLPSAP